MRTLKQVLAIGALLTGIGAGGYPTVAEATTCHWGPANADFNGGANGGYQGGMDCVVPGTNRWVGISMYATDYSSAGSTTGRARTKRWGGSGHPYTLQATPLCDYLPGHADFGPYPVYSGFQSSSDVIQDCPTGYVAHKGGGDARIN